MGALELARKAARTIGCRKELWAFPILATCCSMVAWGLGWFLVVGSWINHGIGSWMPLVLAPTWFVAAYAHAHFQVALAHGLMNPDREAAMDEALGAAWTTRTQVAGWTLLDGAARGALAMAGRQAGWLPGLAWLGGMAWSTATFVTAPLLAQGRPLLEAVTQSAQVVRNNLADSVVGLGGLWIGFRLAQGLVGGVGTLGVWLFVMSGSPILGVATGLMAGIAILALMAIQQAMAVAFAVQLLDQAGVPSDGGEQGIHPVGASVLG